MNCFSCAATMPYRVGAPRITTSAQARSSTIASGTSWVSRRCACQPELERIASSGANSRTLRRRTSAPASPAASHTAWAIWYVMPVAL